MPVKSSVSEAYTLLGLEQGASMDHVRSAYKQLALRTHPDKNPGNAEATTQFQQLSEAYALLQSHHSHSEPLPYCPCGHMHDDDYFYVDEDDDLYSDDEDYDSDDEDRLRFFMFIFEEVLNGRSGRGYTRGARRPDYRNAPDESREEYEARLKRATEERAQAEARRAQEKAERKAFEAQVREKERKKTGERQRAKAASRRAEAENHRRKAAETAQLQQQRVQTLRSAAFVAARAGDASKVKKCVWEDEVDPAGGEIKMGCENYVATQPEDPMETLLHIAARSGDADLVEWLDAHSADPEERNSFGLSAFHIALRHGHIPVLKHFFESYDPKEEDHDGIYSIAPPRSLLSLALDSAEPEVVWMILDRGFATSQDVGAAWTEVTSLDGKQALLKKMGSKDSVKYTEIQNLLMSYGGFTPPPTPKVPAEEGEQTRPPLSGSSGYRKGFRPRGQGTHRLSASMRRPSSLNETPVPMRSGVGDPSWHPPENGERGKTRGRGRGHGRGRGRGRGRGHAN